MLCYADFNFLAHLVPLGVRVPMKGEDTRGVCNIPEEGGREGGGIHEEI